VQLHFSALPAALLLWARRLFPAVEQKPFFLGAGLVAAFFVAIGFIVVFG
jgi:hypothetical protein